MNIKENDELVFIKDYQPFKKGDLVKVFKGITGYTRNCLLVKQSNNYDRNVDDLGFKDAVVKVIS